MGFPILVRWHFYIESEPCLFSVSYSNSIFSHLSNYQFSLHQVLTLWYITLHMRIDFMCSAGLLFLGNCTQISCHLSSASWFTKSVTVWVFALSLCCAHPIVSSSILRQNWYPILPKYLKDVTASFFAIQVQHHKIMYQHADIMCIREISHTASYLLTIFSYHPIFQIGKRSTNLLMPCRFQPNGSMNTWTFCKCILNCDLVNKNSSVFK